MFSSLFRSISWQLGLRYIFARQQSRSVAFISRVAMIGIVLGVALLIVVLSVMNGFDRELRERILGIMPQITLYHGQGIKEWPSFREQLLVNDQVVAAAPFVELQGMANVGKRTEPLLIFGVDAELEPSVSIIDRFLEPNTLQRLSEQSTSIALGSELAEKLGLIVGDRFNVIIPRASGKAQTPAIRRMELIAVINTQTEIDSALALVGLNTAAGLASNADVVTGLHIKGHDLFEASYVARQLQAQLPYGYYTTDWTRTHGNIYYAIQLSKSLVSLLLLLIIAIAAFNVVSTLVMVVIDKQGDIAILRTLGLSRKQTLAVFMIQGGMIGVIGTIIGVLLGIVLAANTQSLVAWLEQLLGMRFLQSDTYPVSYLPSAILWSDVLFIVAISLVMSFLATLYPALRASKVNPAEALRYE